VNVNLHELINAPFGVAERTLRDAGLWKDVSPEGGEMFTVRVEFSVGMDDQIDVEAATPEEARKKAIEMVEDEWSGQGHVEIHRVQVRE
jgi:hypothetical protein